MVTDAGAVAAAATDAGTAGATFEAAEVLTRPSSMAPSRVAFPALRFHAATSEWSKTLRENIYDLALTHPPMKETWHR